MIVEFQRFVEFNDRWPYDKTGTRDGMTFEPVSLNLEYVSSIKRFLVAGGIQFCDVFMVDRGQNFILDKTYEEMRDLLKASKQ